MCTYTYVHIYVYIHIYIQVYVCKYTYVYTGDLVWKNRDAALDKKLEALITRTDAQGAALRSSGVTVSVSGSIGQPLLIKLQDGKGHRCVGGWVFRGGGGGGRGVGVYVYVHIYIIHVCV